MTHATRAMAAADKADAAYAMAKRNRRLIRQEARWANQDADAAVLAELDCLDEDAKRHADSAEAHANEAECWARTK